MASDRVDFPASDGYRMIQADVRMRVTTRQIIDGDPLWLIVDDDPALFVFVPDSTQSPVTWRLVLQQDNR